VIPVEVQAHRKSFINTLATSRVAEVALFTSGMVIAFFHLFLRVNATRFQIKPIHELEASTRPERPKIRFFGPSDLEVTISGPTALQGGRRPESRQGLIDVGPEKNRYDFEADYFVRPDRPLTPASAKTQGSIDPTKWPLPPDPAQTTRPKGDIPGLHKRRKSSYSLFPTRAEDVPRLPPTVYLSDKPTANRSNIFSSLANRRRSQRSSRTDTESVTDVDEAFSFLAKPLPLFAGKHGRQDSTASSATVEIGLRFSVAPATLAAAKCTKVERSAQPSRLRAPLQQNESDTSVTTLEVPIQPPSNYVSSSEDMSLSHSLNSFSFAEPSPRTQSPSNSSPGTASALPTLSPATYLQDQRDKTLPPSPHSTDPSPHSHSAKSGLHMNPISPSSIRSVSPSTGGRSSPAQSNRARSPTAKIPLGAGTMARSSPRNGWI
jgi:hypothetical protein